VAAGCRFTTQHSDIAKTAFVAGVQALWLGPVVCTQQQGAWWLVSYVNAQVIKPDFTRAVTAFKSEQSGF
jgi:hypothetical protein